MLSPAELKQAREDLGLSRRQFAAAVGVQLRTVISWENPSQRRRPSKAVLKQLERLQELEQMLRDLKAAGRR